MSLSLIHIYSARAGVHMQSPKTFLTKMELPAPINVIFGIITSFRRRAPFYIKLVFHCSYKHSFDKVFLQERIYQNDGERGYPQDTKSQELKSCVFANFTTLP